MSHVERQFERWRRERTYFARILAGTGALSPEDAEELAHDLAEIAEVCRTVPSRVATLMERLSHGSLGDTRTLESLCDLIGEFREHLPRHLAGALAGLDKLWDLTHSTLGNAGWTEDVVSRALFIEVAVESLRRRDPTAPPEAEIAYRRRALEQLSTGIQKMEADLEELPDPAREQLRAKLEEWRMELKRAQVG